MPIHIQNQETHQHGDHVVHGHHPPKTNLNPNTKPKRLISLFLKCIVMALVLSLFLVFLLFLGFAALVLLHFLVTSTAFHRRHRRRQRFPARTPTTTTTTSSNLQELPCVSYSVSQQSVKDCAICLDSFKDGESCRNLPGCGHLFHVKCVDSWLTRVLNCPICRARVRLDSGNSSSVICDEDWKIWWTVGVSA